jgi:ATP synthase protein I
MDGNKKSLSSLKQRIDEAEDARKMAEDRTSSRAHLPADAMALVGRIATEMVAGIVVGGFIGWLLDKWLGTAPLLMIVLFFLGAGAGMMNIWRMANGHGLKVGYFDQHNSDAGDGQNKKRTRSK